MGKLQVKSGLRTSRGQRHPGILGRQLERIKKRAGQRICRSANQGSHGQDSNEEDCCQVTVGQAQPRQRDPKAWISGRTQMGIGSGCAEYLALDARPRFHRQNRLGDSHQHLGGTE